MFKILKKIDKLVKILYNNLVISIESKINIT